jgi:hypothetical protein
MLANGFLRLAYPAENDPRQMYTSADIEISEE